MKHRVLAVAYSYPPIAGSGAIRNSKLLQALPPQGWDVRVLTVREGQDAPADAEDALEVVRTRCLYTHRVLVAIKDFVTLKWLRKRLSRPARSGKSSTQEASDANSEAPSAPKGLKALIENLVAIPDKYIGWLPFATWAGIRSLRREPVDVIYAIGKPWTGFFVGYLLKLYSGRPLVIDFMDPWRASTWARSMGRLLDGLQDRLEKFIVARADFVVANTQELADDFIARLQVPPEKVGVITCGYDPADFSATSDVTLPHPGRFTVTHTGSFYKKRTPLNFLRALRSLIVDGEIPAGDVQVNLVGNIACRDAETVSILNDPVLADVIHRESWVPHETAIAYLRSSDVLLLVQPETMLQIPAKLYEYAALHKPILALVEQDGAACNMIQREQWGQAVHAEDVSAITASLRQMYRSYQSGTLEGAIDEASVRQYSVPCLAERLGQIFEQLSSSPAPSAARAENSIA